MKKVIVLALVVAVAFSITACGSAEMSIELPIGEEEINTIGATIDNVGTQISNLTGTIGEITEQVTVIGEQIAAVGEAASQIATIQ